MIVLSNAASVSGVTVSERSDFLTVLEWLYQDDETVGHSRTRFGRIAFNIELGRVGASHERELCFCWR